MKISSAGKPINPAGNYLTHSQITAGNPSDWIHESRLPPPEEEKDVKTAIGAARTKQNRKTMLWAAKRAFNELASLFAQRLPIRNTRRTGTK